LRVRISRCTNNYGPHQADEKFLPTVIRNALQDRSVPIYAQGENKRDWLYVTDHTDALELLLVRKEGDGQIFHVSANEERRNIDVAKDILKVLGKPENLLTFVTDRPGHDWRYALDSSALRLSGWKPKVGFEEGIRKTVEWFRERAAS
jgi:dTDP-glucose 4,6-dehydratase